MGEAIIKKVEGPIVVSKETKDFHMNEVVLLGEEGLIGEVIKINGDEATVQVYEDTIGLYPGIKIFGTGKPLSAELGPGLVSNTFDGIQRPLATIKVKQGIFVKRGAKVTPLSRERKWKVELKVRKGDVVGPNSIVGEVEETSLIKHRILIPPGIRGKVIEVEEKSEYLVTDTICLLEKENGERVEIKLFHSWPIRRKRPILERIPPKEIMVTGQRVIDTVFPIAKGGVAAIPGGFGTGKTVTQHSLAKWSDVDLIVYIGCGERGNEMAQVLEEFSKLKDPRTDRFLLERTVLIANTSNMPVTARESSIYTGITIAEYFRDMGYDVALFADSTSRWAEALREISARMEEMPAEKGYPAYLGSRLAEFYERGGCAKVTEDRIGSISIVGAVSPPGGDFTEPVTSHTKRFIGALWVLDRELAYSRHYPAISWMESYSDYLDKVSEWWEEKGLPIVEFRKRLMNVLIAEASLREIVQLVGEGALPEKERLTLRIAELIKEGFLQQNALSSTDAYCSPEKQYKMLEIIFYFADEVEELLKIGVPLFKIEESPIFSMIKRMGEEIRNEEIFKFDELKEKIKEEFSNLREKYG
ncbi:MAG: V-type ATP synthase subunit A [candidate division WOR-3 bacterium]